MTSFPLLRLATTPNPPQGLAHLDPIPSTRVRRATHHAYIEMAKGTSNAPGFSDWPKRRSSGLQDVALAFLPVSPAPRLLRMSGTILLQSPCMTVGM